MSQEDVGVQVRRGHIDQRLPYGRSPLQERVGESHGDTMTDAEKPSLGVDIRLRQTRQWEQGGNSVARGEDQFLETHAPLLEHTQEEAPCHNSTSPSAPVADANVFPLTDSSDLDENVNQPRETVYPEGGLRAYSVVFGSFCGMLAAFGLMNTIGVYQTYISTHQLSSYSDSAVGWIFGLYLFLAFFCGIQIGPVFDAKGPRWLILSGSVCLVGAIMGLAESTSTSTYGCLGKCRSLSRV